MSTSEIEFKKFESIFKIDGLPILPPLMTPEKRVEMQNYRLQAIYLEGYYINKNCKKIDQFDEHTSLKIEEPVSDCISNKLGKNACTGTGRFKNELSNLKQSDTFVYDVISNTVIISSEQDNLCDSSVISDKENFSSTLSQLPSVCKDDNVHINSFQKFQYEANENMFNTSVNRECSSFLILPPSSDEIDNSNCFSAEKHIPYIPTVNNDDISVDCGASLIRSNSYIIETPSPVLLKHMHQNKKSHQTNSAIGYKTSNNLAPTNCRKIANQSTKVVSYKKKYIKQSDGNIESKKNVCTSNINVFLNKKSPYDSKLSSKTKSFKKQRNFVYKENSSNLKSKTIISSNFTNAILTSNKTSNNYSKYLQKILKEFEEQHKLKLVELLKIQQENNKAQKLYEKQMLENLTLQIKSATLPSQSALTINRPKSEIQIISDKYDTIPRYFEPLYNECDKIPSTTENLISDSNKKEIASTIITKYVRGYLTRRVFKTYHVMKVTQTIRSTLVIVIDLYKKSKFNNSSEKMKFKRQMLNQLKLACYTLHKIFFEISIAERMFLISQDRNNLKNQSKNV